MNTPEASPRKRRKQQLFVLTALVVIVLIALRLALPYWVANYLNGKLDHMGDYHGHLADVDLHLWRGAYSIDQLVIVKRGDEQPVPLLKAPRIDLSVSWHALLHGAVVARVAFEQPELNFVGRGNDVPQHGGGVDWRHKLEQMLPIRLDEVTVHDGEVHFRNFTSKPKVNLVADQLQASIHNLGNKRVRGQRRAADLELTARMFGQAPLQASARFDPLESKALQDFRLDVKLTNVDLTRINDFLKAYAHLDVESGSGDFVLQLEARNGQLNGYAKPLFREVDIFSLRHDIGQQHDNPLRAAWEAIAGGIQNLFKNQGKSQFATRVEIHGQIGDTQTSAWQAIVSILHNAFVKAYKAQFENLPERSAEDDGGGKGD